MFISRGVQNGCLSNLLLFRQVAPLRSIMLLIWILAHSLGYSLDHSLAHSVSVTVFAGCQCRSQIWHPVPAGCQATSREVMLGMVRVYPFPQADTEDYDWGAQIHQGYHHALCQGKLRLHQMEADVVINILLSPRKVLIHLTSNGAFCNTLGHTEYLNWGGEIKMKVAERTTFTRGSRSLWPLSHQPPNLFLSTAKQGR